MGWLDKVATKEADKKRAAEAAHQSELVRMALADRSARANEALSVMHDDMAPSYARNGAADMLYENSIKTPGIVNVNNGGVKVSDGLASYLLELDRANVNGAGYNQGSLQYQIERNPAVEAQWGDKTLAYKQ